MTYITWFDPGVSTGIVRAWFDDTHHYEADSIWQIPGAFVGLEAWLNRREETHGAWPSLEIVGSEKFIPRPIDGGSHTLESTYPLVQEGLLMARGVMPVYPQGNWQPATSQVLKRGRDAVESKKLSDDLLKEHGLWLTGTDVGAGDAADVISVTKHILFFLTRTLKHKPTLEWLYGEEN